MALSVSCLFDLDIGSFFSHQGAQTLLSPGAKKKQQKGAEFWRKMAAHVNDGLGSEQSWGKPGEKDQEFLFGRLKLTKLEITSSFWA